MCYAMSDTDLDCAVPDAMRCAVLTEGVWYQELVGKQGETTDFLILARYLTPYS